MTLDRGFWRTCGGFIVLWLCHFAYGQEQTQAASSATPPDYSALAQLRAAADQAYVSEKAACYQMFAVNPCLTKARQKRSAVIADIKRQEVALHDVERQRKAALQLEKQAEKISAESQHAAAEQREKRAAVANEKQLTAAEKALEKGHRVPVTVAERQHEKAQKEAQKARDPKAAPVKNQDAVQKSIGFDQKQKEAAAHLAEVEKTRRERTKPLSAPLPATGAASTPLIPRLASP